MTSRRWTDRYLNELIDFGGHAMTRGEVVACMQADGHPQAGIDRWLQGQELMAKLRAQRERLSVRLVLAPARQRRQSA